jgi:hypothetical protein
MDRRSFLGRAGLALTGCAAAPCGAQQNGGPVPIAPSSEPFANLRGGGPHHLTPEQEAQRVTASPAPAGPPGRWAARAALPLPRSEMAWATAAQGRMHIVGGYGEGQVNRAYHHIYDPLADRWLDGAPLPRGANHVAVAAEGGRVYAFGGFVEQNGVPMPTPTPTRSRATAGSRSRRCRGRAARRRRSCSTGAFI